MSTMPDAPFSVADPTHANSDLGSTSCKVITSGPTEVFHMARPTKAPAPSVPASPPQLDATTASATPPPPPPATTVTDAATPPTTAAPRTTHRHPVLDAAPLQIVTPHLTISLANPGPNDVTVLSINDANGQQLSAPVTRTDLHRLYVTIAATFRRMDAVNRLTAAEPPVKP